MSQPQIKFDPTKLILAIDPATRTGWAHSNGRSGAISFKQPLDDIGPFIRDIAKRFGVKQIAIEHSVFGGRFNQTRDFHARMRQQIENVNKELGLPPLKCYGISSIKAFWGGHGRASKNDMKRWASIWMGREVTDDNEADALGILALCDQDYQPQKKSKPKRKTKVKLKQSKLW